MEEKATFREPKLEKLWREVKEKNIGRHFKNLRD